MDGVKHGFVLSREGWAERIRECEDNPARWNASTPIKHIAFFGEQVLTDARLLNPEPPYILYSLLKCDVDLNGELTYTWMHVIFGPKEAGFLSAHAAERVKVAREKKEEELVVGKEERLANLAEDLEMDLDSEENLGVIGMEEATRSDKEDRLHRRK